MKQISQRALVFHTSHYSPTVTELGREIPTGKNWQKKKKRSWKFSNDTIDVHCF